MHEINGADGPGPEVCGAFSFLCLFKLVTPFYRALGYWVVSFHSCCLFKLFTLFSRALGSTGTHTTVGWLVATTGKLGEELWSNPTTIQRFVLGNLSGSALKDGEGLTFWLWLGDNQNLRYFALLMLNWNLEFVKCRNRPFVYAMVYSMDVIILCLQVSWRECAKLVEPCGQPMETRWLHLCPLLRCNIFNPSLSSSSSSPFFVAGVSLHYL